MDLEDAVGAMPLDRPLLSQAQPMLPPHSPIVKRLQALDDKLGVWLLNNLPLLRSPRARLAPPGFTQIVSGILWTTFPVVLPLVLNQVPPQGLAVVRANNKHRAVPLVLRGHQSPLALPLHWVHLEQDLVESVAVATNDSLG